MANKITTFDADTSQEIIDMVRERRSQPPAAPNRHGRIVSPVAREIRWARTTTNYYYPTYPSAGPTYVVEFGEYAPSPDPPYPGATVTTAFTAYDPSWQEVAVDPSDGTLLAEGTVVRVERHDGRWWIRPVDSTPPVHAHVQGGASVFWQDGAGASDTGPYEITSSKVWMFTSSSLGGITSNTLGTSIRSNVPAAYDDYAIDLLQKPRYIVRCTTIWALPPLTLSNARSLFQGAGHTHSYTDNGVGMTTGSTQPDLRGLDDGGVVKVTTWVRDVNTVSTVYADRFCGMSTLRPFYDEAGGTHYACHSWAMVIQQTTTPRSLRFYCIRDDSTAYVAPEVSSFEVEIQQAGVITTF